MTGVREPQRCLVLRLAGPLQSWGGRSQFNRRDTEPEPTKSGLTGLLAAAQGRRRTDPIEDLLDLSIGIRTDQPGTLLRDYHTVSDYRGRPLLSAAVNRSGRQKPTSPAKFTGVTQRYYLQDAVFVAAVTGPDQLLNALTTALRHPAFPLALGRRSCTPTHPILLPPTLSTTPAPTDEPPTTPGAMLWNGGLSDVLEAVPWQASTHHRRARHRQHTGSADSPQPAPAWVTLPVTLDAVDGDDIRHDLPSSFDLRERQFSTRRVHQDWVQAPNPDAPTDDRPSRTRPGDDHDPFALLEG